MQVGKVAQILGVDMERVKVRHGLSVLGEGMGLRWERVPLTDAAR
jgi:hypothetical protein